jgi:hypothetical protein
MTQTNSDYTFCTLALGHKYSLLAQKMAQNLLQNAPDRKFVVLTDDPKAVSHFPNVIPKAFRQKGILHCYNDKRFAIEHALKFSDTAIMIDVDAGFQERIPALDFQPGIEGNFESLVEHVSKFTPERLPSIAKVAQKLNIDYENAVWVGESIFAVTRDGGKERDFLHYWEQIGRYFELHKIYAGEGNAVGLAAAKVGWTPLKSEAWQTLKSLWHHFDASSQRLEPSMLKFWQRRLAFHYRLNLERVKALEDFNFYFR